MAELYKIKSNITLTHDIAIASFDATSTTNRIFLTVFNSKIKRLCCLIR